MHQMQRYIQIGAFVDCKWVTVKVPYQMLTSAGRCDLTGLKGAIVRVQLTCYSG